MLLISHLNTERSIPIKTRKRPGLSPYQLGIRTVRFCIYNQTQVLNLWLNKFLNAKLFIVFYHLLDSNSL